MYLGNASESKIFSFESSYRIVYLAACWHARQAGDYWGLLIRGTCQIQAANYFVVLIEDYPWLRSAVGGPISSMNIARFQCGNVGERVTGHALETFTLFDSKRRVGVVVYSCFGDATGDTTAVLIAVATFDKYYEAHNRNYYA